MAGAGGLDGGGLIGGSAAAAYTEEFDDPTELAMYAEALADALLKEPPEAPSETPTVDTTRNAIEGDTNARVETLPTSAPPPPPPDDDRKSELADGSGL